MKQSDWERYADSDEDRDEEEMYRFVSEFFPCFKDPDGNSYFD
jgi:hypothetical protein